VNSDWLDIDLLEDYLDGKLDSSAMHKIEKQALEDPFVAQALAGLSESPRRAKDSVSLLQKQLYERIALQQVSKKSSVFTWQRLSVAAAAAVMFISVSILFFMRDRQNREQLAKGRTKKVEVNMAPVPAVIDSVKNSDYAAVAPAKTINPVPVRSAVKEVQSNVGTERLVQPYGLQKAVVAEAVDSAVTSANTARTATAVSAIATTVAPAVSSPIGGWAGLDTYLSENNKLAKVKSGKFVELSFLIDNEGKPSSIIVVKGADKEFDEEAIRLIKEGPKWEQPKSPETRVNYTITF
jgi:TonB family protein